MYQRENKLLRCFTPSTIFLGICLPSDKSITEMERKQFQNFYHQIADLYIFGNGELGNINYKEDNAFCLCSH